jgi:hypothetical protein
MANIEEARRVIGQAIIDGLLAPGQDGGFVVIADYAQTQGGYWQSDGGGHAQGSGDYHQGKTAAVRALP